MNCWQTANFFESSQLNLLMISKVVQNLYCKSATYKGVLKNKFVVPWVASAISPIFALQILKPLRGWPQQKQTK